LLVLEKDSSTWNASATEMNCWSIWPRTGSVVGTKLPVAKSATGVLAHGPYFRILESYIAPHHSKQRMNSPHRGVWNEEALLASREIILCESVIDALTFWCAGLRNVTTSYGVNGFTEDHRAAFQQHGTRNVWIAYDRDEAGDTAAERLKEELSGMGIGSHRVLFPKGMDANEYARKVTPAQQSLAVLLNRAEWWGKTTAPKTSGATAEGSGAGEAHQPGRRRRVCGARCGSR
jgi:hypothetical protein